MRKFILLWLLFISTLTVSAQLRCHVDERFELTSIAFRLAGAEEYINNQVKNYVTDIDGYFAPYKEHPLILYIKKIREQDEIAFDAVSGVTVLLEIKNKQIFLNPQKDIDAFLQHEKRWKKETLDKFVKLLSKFYNDTKFRIFYNRHLDLYTETEERFDELLETVRMEWFQSFFGKPSGKPFVYISLCNGRSNYALSNTYDKTGTSDYGIIIGCSHVDEKNIPVFITYYDKKEGKPYYNKEVVTLVVHEFAHHFSNPIISKYEPEMIEAANKIFPFVKAQLAKVAYGSPNSILIEGFNELFTNMYFHDNSFIDPYNVAKDERYGFIWMNRAIRFMENFSANRNLYPSIEDFMPQLVAFINSCSENIEQIADEYNHKNPYVVNVFPGLNTTVPADIKEIRIDFSLPMAEAWGISLSEQSNVIFPEIEPTSCYWSENKKTFIMPVTLEKGKNYALRYNRGFQSSETYPMIEDFEIRFKTKE